MANFLVTYYDLGEAKKTALRIQKKLLDSNNKVEIFPLEINNNLSIREQFKKEKELFLTEKIVIDEFDYVIIGTPVISFTSVPAINIFIRQLENIENKKFILFATGIGLPGKAIKKMSSLLSMKNGKVISSKVFSSIFEFDERKLKEVDKFVEESIITKN